MFNPFKICKRKPLRFFSSIALFGGVFYFFVFFTSSFLYPKLPSEKNPIILYSNQVGDDLKKIFLRAIKQTKSSIFLQIYGFTEDDLIASLAKAHAKGIFTEIFYDPSASKALQKKLPQAIPLSCKGLMHKKILVSDQTTSFIGTANFTQTSLCMHDNLVIGLYHKELALFLESSLENHLFFTIAGQRAEFWHLPDLQHQCLNRVIHSLQEAKKSIYIALFAFTHKKIIQELILAKKRGVQVFVALDFYNAQGSGKKTIVTLLEADIPLWISPGGGKLLHHKWCSIDEQTLLLGSTNWTQSAFTKNEDCLLILQDLTRPQNICIRKIWKSIESNSIRKTLKN